MNPLVQPSWFDKALMAIAPNAGLRHMVARERLHAFHYGAAVSSRARGDTRPSLPSESPQNQRDRVRMMDSARDLVDNVGFVRGILLKIAVYVCGTLRYQALTGDKATNQAYEDYLAEWFGVCDLTGRHSFRELMQLSLISMIRDGDIGFIVHNADETTGASIKLQAIEADRIGGLYENGTTAKAFGGITVDANGSPVSYKIYDRDPNNSYSNPHEIPAAAFIHLFDPLRVDQYRGITAFATAIENLKDIREILDYEKMAVKWGAAQGGVIYSESGADESGYSFDTTQKDANNNTMGLQTVEPGFNRILTPGEKVEMFKNDRPSTVFTGFMELLYREVAHAFNLPYGFVHDLSKLGGPTARLESAQAQRSFARLQMLLEEKLMGKIVVRALSDGIQRNKIPPSKLWQRGKWIFPAHPTIDVGRESQANLNENRQGLKSAAEIYAEQGRDVDEEQRQIAIEAENLILLAQDVAKKTGVTFEIAMNLIAMKNQQGLLPPPAPAAGEEQGAFSIPTRLLNGFH